MKNFCLILIFFFIIYSLGWICKNLDFYSAGSALFNSVKYEFTKENISRSFYTLKKAFK